VNCNTTHYRAARREPSVTRRGRRPTPSTSTRSWSKSTQTLASRARPWVLWTPSSTTSSRESPTKPQSCPTTTDARPSRAARYKLRYAYFCPVNWLSTPSVKAQRRWPSTLAPS